MTKVKWINHLNDDVRQKIQQLFPIIGLLFIVVFFAVVTGGRIFSKTNMVSVLNQAFTLMIVAVGGTFVYAHGGMDMSIGAVQGLCVWIGIMTINATNWFAGLLAVLLLGAFCGFITGGTHVSLGIPAFITSMCVSYICRGIVTTAVANHNIRVKTSFYVFNNWVLKLIVLAAIITLGVILFEFTKIGKSLKAIGGNETASRFDGINVKKNKLAAYMILGSCVGLTAFFAISREGAASAGTGSGLELDMMLAVALGGLPFTGGAAAHMSCAVIGSLIITILGNGLVLWGVPVEAVEGIKGILFLAVIAITYEKNTVNRGLM